MKIKYYINLLKMGFTLREANILKEGADIMTIKEILKLGEMGYTKDEIANMSEEPETDLNTQIETLENQIKSLKDSLQASNTRQNVTDKPDDKSSTVDLQTALNLLAGNGESNNGENGNNGQNS